MTTDSEAWDRFVAILRGNEQHLTADAAAQVAEWLRERQKRGDFRAPEAWQARVPADELAGTLAQALRERDEARAELLNMTESRDGIRAERDHLRRDREGAALTRLMESKAAERVRLAERERGATLEAADRWEQEAGEQRARAEAAEKDRDEWKTVAEGWASGAGAACGRADKANLKETEREVREQRTRADEAAAHCKELRETYLEVLARAEAAERAGSEERRVGKEC